MNNTLGYESHLSVLYEYHLNVHEYYNFTC